MFKRRASPARLLSFLPLQLVMGDAQIGGRDIGQEASGMARRLEGTALQSSFKDRVLKMITVRAAEPPSRAFCPRDAHPPPPPPPPTAPRVTRHHRPGRRAAVRPRHASQNSRRTAHSGTSPHSPSPPLIPGLTQPPGARLGKVRANSGVRREPGVYEHEVGGRERNRNTQAACRVRGSTGNAC